MAVARNYIDFEHYGQINDGIYRDRGLAQSFPVVLPVIICFKLFGIGILQGRLSSILYSIGLLFVSYFFAKKVFNKKVAVLNLILLVFSGLPIHFLLVSVQILGENAMLFYLLSGYLLIASDSQSKNIINRNFILAIFCFTFGIFAKSQISPFLLFSFLTCAAIASLKGNFYLFIRYAALAIFPPVVVLLFSVLNGIFHVFPGELVRPVEDLAKYTVLVWDWNSKVEALLVMIIFVLPSIYASIYFVSSKLKYYKNYKSLDEYLYIFSYALICFSWLSWYLLFSTAWTRYLYPTAVLMTVFLAWAIVDLNYFTSFKRFSQFLKDISAFSSENIKAWLVYFLIPIFCHGIIQSCYTMYEELQDTNSSLIETANFLNSHKNIDNIETYESELFFILEKAYHFPPDTLNVETLRRRIHPDYQLTYVWDSDKYPYLVIGPYARGFQYYSNSKEKIEKSRLIFDNQRYQVYSFE